MTFLSAPPANFTTTKIKGLEVVPESAEGGNFGNLWKDWPWASWIKPQIDLAIGLGANLVKLGGGSVEAQLSGYITAPTAATQAQQFLDYCAGTGLLVYWTMGNTSTSVESGAAALIATELGVLNGYPNVVGIDMCNEINYPSVAIATAQGIMNTLTAPARAATGLALTYSLSIQGAGLYTQAVPQFGAPVVAPYVDFFDFHPYYVSEGEPQPSDLDTFRSQPYYKRWMIGECGYSASVGETQQTARWDAIGATGASSDAYGAVGFSITDFGGSGSGDYGVYEADLTTARAWIATAFAGWPNS